MAIQMILYLCLFIYVTASLALMVYGLNAYVMIGLLRRSLSSPAEPGPQPLGPDPASFPVVTTQLPIFNEQNVAERLLRAVCAMDYPADRHQIQVLDDSTDETTAQLAALTAELRAEGHDIQHLHRTDRKGYKAGAMADALTVARGDFVAVFDADFLPPTDFLLRALPPLVADPGCSFVQTRWGHCNRGHSLLTELQSIGIDGHFIVEQQARCAGGLFFNFNGTAGVWRKESIAAVGGWKADTLTEDLDLSYRVQLAGWRACYLPDVVAPAEVPADINALKSQQRRWATGSIQCARKLLPQVLARPDIGLFKKIEAILHLTHYMIHPLILILTLLALPLGLLLRQDLQLIFTLPLVAVILLAMTGPSSLYITAQVKSGLGWRRAACLMPLLIALGIGLAVNNTVAVCKGLFGDGGGEFVRTPKLGTQAGATGTINSQPRVRYGVSWRPLFGYELFLGVWSLLAFLAYSLVGEPAAGAFLLVQAIGFSLVGVLSLRHHRRERNPVIS